MRECVSACVRERDPLRVYRYIRAYAYMHIDAHTNFGSKNNHTQKQGPLPWVTRQSRVKRAAKSSKVCGRVNVEIFIVTSLRSS